MKWLEADMTKLGDVFAPENFDVVIDKAAMDALMCDEGDVWSPSETVIEQAAAMCSGITSALVPQGTFLQISFAQPHFRKRFLLGEGEQAPSSTVYGWDYSYHNIGALRLEFVYRANHAGSGAMEHSHSHSHAHSHAHEHELGPEHAVDGDEVVRRFTQSRGRAPTPDEEKQLREHGHTHEHMEHAGEFHERDATKAGRDWAQRAFTVGIGGPVGSGKTALMLALCRALKDKFSLAAVTNDIFTREDGEFLVRHDALPEERIRAIETGGCPHAAIREDISANLQACEDLTDEFDAQLLLVESGGGERSCPRELADYIIYVIDVAGGDKVPRKGGPGITQADLLVINKIDLAPHVGADLDVMNRDAKLMRGEGPTVFSQINKGKGVEEIIDQVIGAWEAAA
ncbi:unnamed protein product [Phytophthora fragariaefolia]|uniref:Unnamed protein product n=1 Tax=Phytophthora fragariaefolia TaxID=1490495 RepID=A0A9W6XM04_9STRA|nr:unnamed protein product [Phytophthora fragariaefolia]